LRILLVCSLIHVRASAGPEVVGSAAHRQLSYEASVQGLVLLQNAPVAVVTATAGAGSGAGAGASAGAGAQPTAAAQVVAALPLKRGSTIAVIGPNANGTTVRGLLAGGTGGGTLSATVVCKCASGHDDYCCITPPLDAVRILAEKYGGKVVYAAGTYNQPT
jgi:hypothetical protein